MVGANRSMRISRIRDRGQFTVPQEVRKALSWPEGEIPVRVVALPEEDSFRVERISPPPPAGSHRRLSKAEWTAIRESMKRISRAGKAVNLTDFLREDRDSH